ncbi:MAG: NADH-quinone oxidoreductase subunit J [Chloroflexi bacterium]|nr:NADH-quinone oxidoreductase subunit J [Chloroflexota bacterium]MCZ6891456.1 NADH-quinone oxidoreductase subunit J [Chloroflexota bacterium]
MISLVLFYVAAAIVVGGALGVVGTRNVIHATLFLLVSLMGVAGIYILVFAEFLALVQVLIYGGAIVIVLLFALMLTRNQEFRGRMENPQWPLAAIASIGLFVVLVAAIISDPSDALEKPVHTDFKDLGTSLFTQWAIPFEVASVLLLIALIGAIVIARSGDPE